MNRQFLLAARPRGWVKESDFSYQEIAIPTVSEDQILVKTKYISLDPSMRGHMENRADYAAPLDIGDVMRANGIAEVIESKHADFETGDLVLGSFGMQDYVSLNPQQLKVRKFAAGEDPLAAISVYGGTGMTAYFGLLDICDPKPGETVVVNAAAGAVGSLVGQIAKIKGARVVGIAGADDKCRWIKDDLGFDEAINYKKENVLEMLKKHCPDGIDCVFENVGGQILDDQLTLMNHFSRIALCGLISTYNDLDAPGPKMFRNILMKRIMIKGFIVSDYMARAQEAMADLGKWMKEGKLQYRVDVRPGLENAPQVVKDLFVGANTGKLIIQISDE